MLLLLAALQSTPITFALLKVLLLLLLLPPPPPYC
jgi:hypothetical protein